MARIPGRSGLPSADAPFLRAHGCAHALRAFACSRGPACPGRLACALLGCRQQGLASLSLPRSNSLPCPASARSHIRCRGRRFPPARFAGKAAARPRPSPRAACGWLASRPALAALAGGRRSPPCRAARAACAPLLRPLVIVAAGAPLGPRDARGRPRCSRPRGALAAAPPLYSPPACAAGSPRAHTGGCPCAHGLRPWPRAVGRGWGGGACVRRAISSFLWRN